LFHAAPRKRTRDEDAGIADDQPARLEISVRRGRGGALDHLRIGVGIGRRLLYATDAEPAAEVDVLDRGPSARRVRTKSDNSAKASPNGWSGDLAADAHVDVGDAQSLQLRRLRVPAGAADRDAELVLRLPVASWRGFLRRCRD
jgi:hypothetical protein